MSNGRFRRDPRCVTPWDTRLPPDAEMNALRQAGAFICQCATPKPDAIGECMNRDCRKLVHRKAT